MRKRSRLTKKKSSKNFKKGNGVKTKNYRVGPMRGGIRL